MKLNTAPADGDREPGEPVTMATTKAKAKKRQTPIVFRRSLPTYIFKQPVASNFNTFQSRDTIRATILTMMTGKHTPDDIAQAIAHRTGVEKTRGHVMSHIYCIFRDKGIGYGVDDEDHIQAIFPPGQSYKTAFAD